MTVILVDTNESTDREKNHKDSKGRPDRHLRVDSSNIRAFKRLQSHFGDIVQDIELDCGDIKVVMDNGQSLAIERKRAGDFLGSIANNGHIFKQVESMANGADWHAVIIEGLIHFDRDDFAVIPVFDKQDKVEKMEVTEWHGASVRGAMFAIEFSGCPIITIQPTQLPSAVEGLINFCMKPAEHTQQLGKHRYVTFPPIPLSEEIMLAFPKIGRKRVKSLIEWVTKQSDDEHTLTLADMLCWGSYLGRIAPHSRPEGWGDIIIQNFRATLGLAEGVYLTQEVDKEEIEQKKKRKAMSEQIAKKKAMEKSKTERSKPNGKRK